MIAVLIARHSEYLGEAAFDIDTWLMSCRVLGRKVEEAMLRELAKNASAASVRWIIGRYCETAKNGMVREHYTKLGFMPLDANDKGGARYALDLATFVPADTFIAVTQG